MVGRLVGDAVGNLTGVFEIILLGLSELVVLGVPVEVTSVGYGESTTVSMVGGLVNATFGNCIGD